ncbi:DNA-processing protein DprA [Candidatus Reidiella endopervernicosa]|uniref:DNA-processing protein DprA n=1 Tax=Candidatus Reidiella endopervernicosa TaxID=2738883 RepID=UPI003B968BA4
MSNSEYPIEAVKPWLQLLHTPGIGPRTYAKLLNHFDSPVAAINASTSILKELGLREQSIRHLQQNNEDLICADLEWLEGSANTIITLNDTRYPVLLREIADPPPLLFVHGDPDFLSSLQIAIVGSRNPTTGGSETARDFARHLAGASFTITSGLALGIDAASPGSRYFAKVCFGHPSPSKQQNFTRPFMPSAPRPSCVRCVITSSRLYTTPSVTLRRHKAAAASSSSSARALNYEYADGVDYRGLTALTSLSMAVSARGRTAGWWPHHCRSRYRTRPRLPRPTP